MQTNKHALAFKDILGYEFIQYVNPFFGTERGGNKFPGCLYPFGMVKIGGDFRHLKNYLKVDSYAGYQKQGYLRQVSMLHVSGTGGSPTYGVIGQLPVVINKNNNNLNTLFKKSQNLKKENLFFNIKNGIERRSPDSSHLGYYNIQLKNNVDIEFTSGKKTGYLKYTLQEINNDEDFFIFVNLTEHLHSYNRPWWSQHFEQGNMNVGSDMKSYQGRLTIKNGWSSTESYSVYFYGEFNQKFKNIIDINSTPTLNKINFMFKDKRKVAVLFKFEKHKIMQNPLEAKIGVSYHSIKQAKLNCFEDFQNNWNFDNLVYKNINFWKENVFDRVSNVSSNDSLVLDKFYNSLYGSHLMPTDKSGTESPFYNVHYPNDLYFRAESISQNENKEVNSTVNSNMVSLLHKEQLESENQTLKEYTNLTASLMMQDWLKKSQKQVLKTIGEEPKCEYLETPSFETPYYDDWFTIWDTYRSLHPLLFIIQPEKSKDMINTLSLISDYELFPPDGRSASRTGRTQGGSNSDILISEAIAKRIVTDENDKCKLYKASWRNANIIPPYIKDKAAKDSTNKFGRGALHDWIELHFVSTDYSRSLTRTVEYSNNDFSVALTAKLFGENDSYVQQYLKRSRNWIHLWNTDLSLANYDYNGFLNPKIGTNKRGKFKYNLYESNPNLGKFITDYNPADCKGCYWGDHSYEGTAIEYMFSLNHDILFLVSLVGPKEFEHRLDDMYNLFCSQEKAEDSGLKFKFKSLSGKNCGFADVANEPSFGAGYLYNYVNLQDKTAATIDFITSVEFVTGAQALPGNSDSGAMEAWLWFGLIGIYPISGTSLYLIGTPQLTHLNINNKLIIEARNLNPEKKSGKRQNIFINKVVLNGKTLQRSWLRHEELFQITGSSPNRLVFEMRANPIGWDKEFPTPPSYEQILNNQK